MGMMEKCRKYCSEALGTAVLVGLGCGTAVFARGAGAGFGVVTSAWVMTVALAFGLAMMAMVYALGSISGAHLNPAVSLSMALRKKMGWLECVFYIISQIIGAVLGALALFILIKLMGIPATGNMGVNSYSTGVLAGLATWRQIIIAMLVEIALTFVFVFTFLGVTRKGQNKVVSGIVIGLTLMLVHLMGVAITGASINPARSLAPAFFGGTVALREVWVFIVAPLIGGALAALAAWCKFRNEDDETEVADAEPARPRTTTARSTTARG